MGRRSRKVCLLFAGALLALTLGGCASDYRDIEDLTIVAGIAVDVSQESGGGLSVLFEIADMSSGRALPASKPLMGKGQTFTEAVFSVNEKLKKNLYFGNCEVVVLGRQLVEQEGLFGIVDTLLRDNETRANLHILISGEETAAAIITPPDDFEGIVSFKINEELGLDSRTANSTVSPALYQVYNSLKLESAHVPLPFIRFSGDGDDSLLLDGLMFFRENYPVGTLPRDRLPYYLIAAWKLSGGGYRLDLDGGRYVALLNHRSAPKQRVFFDGEKLTLELSVNMKASVEEFSAGWDEKSNDAIHSLEQIASDSLKTKIEAIFHEYAAAGLDIFSYGDVLRNYEYSLWQEIKDQWPQEIKSIDFSVRCTVTIQNVGPINN